MTSLLARSVKATLSDLFPNTQIKEEIYVNHRGQKLFFDFFLDTPFKIYIEVQGSQHTEFSPFFHQDASAFNAQKKRDKLKQEWCALEDVGLIAINYDEIPISPEALLEKIKATQNG